MNSIGQLNKCSGCSACIQACPKASISFKKSSDGFLYPLIDDKSCVNCGICEKICPWLDSKGNANMSDDFIAAKRKNLKKRMLSQSGGAFSVFAEKILSNRGVVYGVRFLDGKAKYCRIDKLSCLKHIRGSKYLQAEVGNIYACVAEDITNNKKVLFSGTACHIDGLCNYLKFKKISTDNLITIDIICHGVVSPEMFANYKRYLEREYKGILKSFNFRDKSYGWHGHITTFKIGNKLIKSKNYVRLFYSNFCLRSSCYECKYADLRRISDITIGDCWGIGDYFPDFDDNKGVSLIILNTNKGKELFQRSDYEFDWIRIKKEQALQPNLVGPTKKPSNYLCFWSDYEKYGFEYVLFKYCRYDPSNDEQLIRKRNLLKRFKLQLIKLVSKRK